MPATIRVVQMRQKVPEQNQDGCMVVNTCSNSGNWSTDLSPFILGPCNLYGGLISKTMENAWQYSKVYQRHLDDNGDPNPEWHEWSAQGWANSSAVRYPMGKGAKPEYSWWAGLKLGYVDARKAIYAPLYAEAVQKTAGWQTLRKIYEGFDLLVLRDYDGWDYTKKNMTLSQVLNFQGKIMGHACVLAMLLQNDPALGELR